MLLSVVGVDVAADGFLYRGEDETDGLIWKD